MPPLPARSLSEMLARLPFAGPWPITAAADTAGWRAHVRAVPLVYRVRAWDRSTGCPRAIPRAAAADRDGILDIGETGIGARRIADLIGAMQGKPRPHRAGWEYSDAGYGFAAAFPLESLVVEVLQVDSKELAEAIELALLEDYRWRFKDRPPLNGSAGKYRRVEGWLRGLGRAPRGDDGWLAIGDLLPERAG